MARFLPIAVAVMGPAGKAFAGVCTRIAAAIAATGAETIFFIPVPPMWTMR
jgi:hypothetical protein